MLFRPREIHGRTHQKPAEVIMQLAGELRLLILRAGLKVSNQSRRRQLPLGSGTVAIERFEVV